MQDEYIEFCRERLAHHRNISFIDIYKKLPFDFMIGNRHAKCFYLDNDKLKYDNIEKILNFIDTPVNNVDGTKIIILVSKYSIDEKAYINLKCKGIEIRYFPYDAKLRKQQRNCETYVIMFTIVSIIMCFIAIKMGWKFEV